MLSIENQITIGDKNTSDLSGLPILYFIVSKPLIASGIRGGFLEDKIG